MRSASDPKKLLNFLHGGLFHATNTSVLRRSMDVDEHNEAAEIQPSLRRYARKCKRPPKCDYYASDSLGSGGDGSKRDTVAKSCVESDTLELNGSCNDDDEKVIPLSRSETIQGKEYNDATEIQPSLRRYDRKCKMPPKCDYYASDSLGSRGDGNKRDTVAKSRVESDMPVVNGSCNDDDEKVIPLSRSETIRGEECNNPGQNTIVKSRVEESDKIQVDISTPTIQTPKDKECNDAGLITVADQGTPTNPRAAGNSAEKITPPSRKHLDRRCKTETPNKVCNDSKPTNTSDRVSRKSTRKKSPTKDNHSWGMGHRLGRSLLDSEPVGSSIGDRKRVGKVKGNSKHDKDWGAGYRLKDSEQVGMSIDNQKNHEDDPDVMNEYARSAHLLQEKWFGLFTTKGRGRRLLRDEVEDLYEFNLRVVILNNVLLKGNYVFSPFDSSTEIEGGGYRLGGGDEEDDDDMVPMYVSCQLGKRKQEDFGPLNIAKDYQTFHDFVKTTYDPKQYEPDHLLDRVPELFWNIVYWATSVYWETQSGRRWNGVVPLMEKTYKQMLEIAVPDMDMSGINYRRERVLSEKAAENARQIKVGEASTNDFR